MIGYKNDRYLAFGRFATRLDNAANYIPARLTALLRLTITGKQHASPNVWREGRQHASPNAGYPEAALAYILHCQFGGPNYYHDQLIAKPYIGHHAKTITDPNLKTAQ